MPIGGLVSATGVPAAASEVHLTLADTEELPGTIWLMRFPDPVVLTKLIAALATARVKVFGQD